LQGQSFASEEQFPELVNPVQMAWDTKGRLWVSVWRNYPERTPDSKIGDSILIFEDTKEPDTPTNARTSSTISTARPAFSFIRTAFS